jgi:hypothetical protein
MMQFQLKALSREGVPEALNKAIRYRLLNEPSQAESICLDILQIAPANQEALTTLLLALTDQFGSGVSVSQAKDVLKRLDSEYDRAYYAGIIAERSARARMREGHVGAASIIYYELTEAMSWYEKAEASRPPANDDSILRWNTCARTLMQHHELRPEPEVRLEAVLDD